MTSISPARRRSPAGCRIVLCWRAAQALVVAVDLQVAQTANLPGCGERLARCIRPRRRHPLWRSRRGWRCRGSPVGGETRQGRGGCGGLWLGEVGKSRQRRARRGRPVDNGAETAKAATNAATGSLSFRGEEPSVLCLLSQKGDDDFIRDIGRRPAPDYFARTVDKNCVGQGLDAERLVQALAAFHCMRVLHVELG
jgi:hypothetical protein